MEEEEKKEIDGGGGGGGGGGGYNGCRWFVCLVFYFTFQSSNNYRRKLTHSKNLHTVTTGTFGSDDCTHSSCTHDVSVLTIEKESVILSLPVLANCRRAVSREQFPNGQKTSKRREVFLIERNGGTITPLQLGGKQISERGIDFHLYVWTKIACRLSRFRGRSVVGVVVVVVVVHPIALLYNM